MRVVAGCLFFCIVVCVVGCAKEVQFGDSNLEVAIKEVIGKPDGTITEADLKNITELDIQRKGIRDINGIEKCVNLTKLSLPDN